MITATILGVLPCVAVADDRPPTEVARQLETELSNLERSVDRLVRQFGSPQAVVQEFPLQKRLVDARVFFELANYETAAILLMDVLEAPQMANDPDYASAALLLGRSLMEIGNFRGAHEYLTQAARSPDYKLADEARFFLIEMALTGGDEQALMELVREMAAATTDRTRYALGKANLRLGRYNAALTALGGIAASSELFVLAQYYKGVVLTALKQYADALKLFRALSRMEPKTEQQKLARELSLVAAGRLLMDKGEIEAAVTSYQLVPRHSASYEVALYEMAWAYIKREQYDVALRTVDILLLVVEDEQLDVEGHVLRGRLSVLMDDYDQAEDSYDRILDRFAPIRNELRRFTRDPENIDRYFAWLIERRSEQADLKSPLSQRTAGWIESTEGMTRVVSVFDNLSQEREDVRETKQLATDLERIVTSKNRVDLFPELKDGWTKCLALQNQLIALSSSMLDHQNLLARGRVSGETKGELQGLVAWRHKLEERFRKVPQSFRAYEAREARVNESFLDLQRKSFLVEQTLEEVKRQLLAIEKLVNAQQFADRGGKMSASKEDEIRESIAHEKDQLQNLFAELSSVKQDIQVEAEKVGSGDVVSQDESTLAANLIATHKREGNQYDSLSGSIGGASTAVYERYARARERVWSAVERLRGVVNAIDRQVGAKTEELHAVIAAERSHLDRYASELAAYEGDGRQIAHAVGEELFNQAAERMKKVVMEADVGLLDVAWNRKRKKTEAIRRIQSDRADKLEALEVDRKALTEDVNAPPVGAEAVQ